MKVRVNPRDIQQTLARESPLERPAFAPPLGGLVLTDSTAMPSQTRIGSGSSRSEYLKVGIDGIAWVERKNDASMILNHIGSKK
jgi:hypothetical protein